MPCCLMAASEWNIPKHELETLARCFLPDIQAFFESEEGRKEYEEWKEEQVKLKAQKADKSAWKHTRQGVRKLSVFDIYALLLKLGYCIKTVNPNPSPIRKRFGFILFGADNRSRTCTLAHWNLNPACLPIPPYPHNHFLLYKILHSISRTVRE